MYDILYAADFILSTFLLSARTGQSEQFDWLGFSRPDLPAKDAPAGKDAAAEKPSASAASGKDVSRPSGSDAPVAGRMSSRNPKADKGDSRRTSLFDEKSSPEWLDMATDRSAEKKPPSAGGRKSLDWDIAYDDDWLGIKTSSSVEKTDDSAAAYLGLGSEIDFSHKPLRFHSSLVIFVSLLPNKFVAILPHS